MQEYSWEWGNFPKPSPLHPTFKGKGRDIPLNEASHKRALISPDPSPERRQTDDYGAGGRLGASMSDETIFIVSVDGRRSEFELSVIQESEQDTRGRKPRGSESFFDLKQMDEFEAGIIFDAGKLDFESFLDDPKLVDDPNLVIRWNSDQLSLPSVSSHSIHADTISLVTLDTSEDRMNRRSCMP